MSEDSSKNTQLAVSNRVKKLFSWRRPTPAKRSLGSPWLIITNVLAIFIISQLIAAIIVGIGLTVVHGHASGLDQLPVAQFFYVLIAEGLAAFLTIWIVKTKKLPLSVIGLGRRPVLGDLWKALAGFFTFYVLLTIVGFMIDGLAPSVDKGNQNVGFNSLNGSVDIVLAFVALVILPPIGEEILVRGYLYSGLRQKFKFVPAMVLTSLIFGAAHLETGATASLLWSAGIDTFVLSLVLVYLRENTGALYAGMLVHALNNLVAFSVHFHGIIF
ncbi:MAG TPA: type II CAAX endopeptidase family protein [Candidatus Binatia bacterium]|nr:type II CAAX endopeptidase family protein [Candidatus Binatia bacterium]